MTPKAAAILKVSDLDRTIAWYEAAGFELHARTDGDDARWCELGRDSLRLQFVAGDTPWPGAPGMAGCFYVHVDDVSGAFDALRDPVEFEWGIEDRAWGAREVVLRDPDGYFVTLCQSTADA